MAESLEMNAPELGRQNESGNKIRPIALVPFIQSYTTSSTSSLRAVSLSLLAIGTLGCCWLFASTNENRRAVLATARTPKERASIAGGLLLFTCIPPFLGGNLLGAFVTQLESRPTSMTLQVVGVTERTRKMPRTELTLACRDGKERFYAVLSEARLRVPAVKLDTLVTLHGRTNVFGTYINRIDIAPAAQATC